MRDLNEGSLRLCLKYDEVQLERAGRDVESFVFLQNPGETDERELALSRVDVQSREVCAEIEKTTTYALGARVQVWAQERTLALAQAAANMISLTLCGSALILAVLAFGLKVGWLGR